MQHSILPFLVSATTLLFHLEFHGFRSNRGGVCIRLKQVLNINTPCSKRHGEPELHTDRVLKAIADGEQHFSSQAVKQIYNLGNPNTIVKNKKTLQNKDIIEKQNDDFVFVDPIYWLWFKGEYC